MCGRFVLTLPHEAMAELFDAVPANDLPDTPNYNICPSDSVSAVTSEDGTRRLRSMRWGFLPRWYRTPADGPLLINARAETIARKPTFREACFSRRCLVPASGFYEWTRGADGSRLPWHVHPRQKGAMALAGVWQVWERGASSIVTCAIVTTTASTTLSAIHHRMPVILDARDWPLWLGEAGRGAAEAMRPAPDDSLRFHRVNAEVNSSRASGPDLVRPARSACDPAPDPALRPCAAG